jgi:hypothetical protein
VAATVGPSGTPAIAAAVVSSPVAAAAAGPACQTADKVGNQTDGSFPPPAFTAARSIAAGPVAAGPMAAGAAGPIAAGARAAGSVAATADGLIGGGALLPGFAGALLLVLCALHRFVRGAALLGVLCAALLAIESQN